MNLEGSFVRWRTTGGEEMVENNWEFSNSLTMQMVEGLIQQEKLLGLFLPCDDEPVAWITIYRY